MPERLLRLEEVAHRTGLSVHALRTMRWAQAKGKPTHLPPLEFQHLGRRLVVVESALDAWIAEVVEVKAEAPAA